MTDFRELVDIAAERLGGAVLWASDEFFAEKENLLRPEEAVFVPGKYTDRGKWMDGWESRRKRGPGHDTCVVRLGLPGVVRGVVVDTAFFKGNYPQACSIEGATFPKHEGQAAVLASGVRWTEILPRSPLRGDDKNLFAIACDKRFSHLRLHIYPDGGVARLRVHGDVLLPPRWMGRRDRPELVDLAAAEHGAVVVACNDMFFGSRHNLVMPGRGANMGDGWETKRSRAAGPDWVTLRLAVEGTIERVVLDTLHFKGNAPESAAIDVACASPGGPGPSGSSEEGWAPLLPRTKLVPHTAHVFDEELAACGDATHARLRIWPDGGVSRLRLFGVASAAGRERAGMRHLRAMTDGELEGLLLAACASRAWAAAVAKERPFATWSELLRRGAEIWASLSPADWDEAFRAHPRIGERHAAAPGSELASSFSAREQASVAAASADELGALAAANRAYEERFGRIYIVCATGKSAEELRAIAEERMKNELDAELTRAADEQRKITELRLAKLVLS